MKPDFDIILVTADEPFYGLWHTQIIYTEYLSSQGKVFFIEPPSKWNFSHLFKFGMKQQEIHKNLTILSYTNIFPASLAPFEYFNEWYNQWSVKRKLKKQNINSLLIWHFDSFRSCFNLSVFKKAFHIKRIYGIIDPFMENPKNTLLSKLADLLVVTSPKNNEHYSAYSHKLINIPQVVNVEQSKEWVRRESITTFDLNKPFIVLLGTISDDVDLEVLIKLTKQPDYNLLLIGKIVGLKENEEPLKTLLSRPNVQFAGVLKPEEFYPIIAKAKAGLLIYKKEKRLKPFSPLKVINYLIAGIPTLSNLDSEVSQLNGKCIYNFSDFPSLSLLAEQALKQELPFDTSSANTYLSSIDIKEAVNKILSRI